MVRRVVVVDEESPGSSCVAGGGLLLRRTPCTGGGDELAIGAVGWLIDAIEVARSAVRMRGRSWRAQFSGRGPPFIVARGGRGARLGSPSSSLFQGGEGASDGRDVFLVSR